MQLEARMGRKHLRKRLSVHHPAQHLKTRVPISEFATGREGWVRHATFAQQVKMVRHERAHRSHTAAAVRPPLYLNENAVIYVVPYEEITPVIATHTKHA